MAHEEPRKSLEQIVAEVERYPMEAYVFVQECVGVAAEGVHGALSSAQATIAQWMAHRDVTAEELSRQEREGLLPPDIASLPTVPIMPLPTDSWYVIEAIADNDNDGVCCVVAGTSLNGEVYVQNEGE